MSDVLRTNHLVFNTAKDLEGNKIQSLSLDISICMNRCKPQPEKARTWKGKNLERQLVMY